MRTIEENDIVIRPSGIWNTRAPLYRYIEEHRKDNEVYYALLLSITKMLSESEKLLQEDSISRIFNHKKFSRHAQAAFSAYKKSFEDDSYGNKIDPTIEMLTKSLTNSISVISEHAIVGYLGLFETFSQCWALNYLLARQETKIESEKGWTKYERNLAKAFSPLSKEFSPNSARIFNSIPQIKEILEKTPHIRKHPQTKKVISEPISSKLNAYTVVIFWREWRNLLVHNSGIVNAKFCKDHQSFWKEFSDIYPHIKPFEKGRKLSLNDETFRAMTTAHYCAAIALRNWIVELSSEKRGHSNAPYPLQSGYIAKRETSLPKLLTEGDHEKSLLWETDFEFRRKMQLILKPVKT